MANKKGVIREMPYNSLFLGWHYRKILREAVKLAELKGNEKVLDFGCETQYLKKFLPEGTSYIGYDIVPECSDVEDYKKVKADVVFCLNTLEHLNEEGLKTVLKDFRKMGVEKVIIALPIDNPLRRFLEFISNYDAANTFEHLLQTKQVANLLVIEFGLPCKVKRLNGIQYLAVFKLEYNQLRK